MLYEVITPFLEQRGHGQHDVGIGHGLVEELVHGDDHLQGVEGLLQLGPVEVLGERVLASYNFV